MTSLSEPQFVGDVNVAMKFPPADYDAAVAFYRDTLGFQVSDDVEPLEGLGERMHWIRNPAGIVHLLAQDG